MTLVPIDERALARLLDAAVAGADPTEVMPPIAGPPGWNDERRHAFLEFHRSRSLNPATAVERTWVVEVDGAAVGAVRLENHGDLLEAGIWLSRDHRRRGVGTRVTTLLLAEARAAGARKFVASTTADNLGAQALLATAGAVLTVDQHEVRADLSIA